VKSSGKVKTEVVPSVSTEKAGITLLSGSVVIPTVLTTFRT